MLISSKAAESRLNSPGNLINRLREGRNGNSLSIFGVGKRKEEVKAPQGKIELPKFETKIHEEVHTKVHIPEILPPEKKVPPTIDDLVKTPENDIKLEAIHSNAMETLSAAMIEIKSRIPEVSKVKDLADIAAKMSKIVTDIRAEKNKDNDQDQQVHLHFYTPERKKLSDFQTIEG